MRPYLLVLILIFAFTSCYNYNRRFGVDTLEIHDVKLYTSLAGTSANLERKLRSLEIKRVLMVNGGYYEIKGSLSFKKEELKKYVELNLPAKETMAYIVLDFEGENIKLLRSTKSKMEFDNLIEYYMSVYKFVKELRPNCTIGFYGLPWRDYWNRNDKWRKDNESLLKLLSTTDAIFPSMYDFYVDNLEVSENQDSMYMVDNTLEALRIGKLSGNKPVYPFVWHRYHPSNKNHSLSFMNPEEFSRNIRIIKQQVYRGHKISGIIWWSSEKYFYNLDRKNGLSLDFEKYSEQSTMKYLQYVLKGLNHKEGNNN